MKCFFTVRDYLLHVLSQSWRSKSCQLLAFTFLSTLAATGHFWPSTNRELSLVRLALRTQTLGSLFYLTPIACHLLLLLHRACGRTVEWATISEPTGSNNRKLSGKIMTLYITKSILLLLLLLLLLL